jgi:hypothetical protein
MTQVALVVLYCMLFASLVNLEGNRVDVNNLIGEFSEIVVDFL